MNDTLYELIESIQFASNVASVSYDPQGQLWTINYHNGEPNEVETDDLIDFLKNA